MRGLLTETNAFSLVATTSEDDGDDKDRVVAIVRLRRMPASYVFVAPLLAETPVCWLFVRLRVKGERFG